MREFILTELVELGSLHDRAKLTGKVLAEEMVKVRRNYHGTIQTLESMAETFFLHLSQLQSDLNSMAATTVSAALTPCAAEPGQTQHVSVITAAKVQQHLDTFQDLRQNSLSLMKVTLEDALKSFNLRCLSIQQMSGFQIQSGNAGRRTSTVASTRKPSNVNHKQAKAAENADVFEFALLALKDIIQLTPADKQLMSVDLYDFAAFYQPQLDKLQREIEMRSDAFEEHARLLLEETTFLGQVDRLHASLVLESRCIVSI